MRGRPLVPDEELRAREEQLRRRLLEGKKRAKPDDGLRALFVKHLAGRGIHWQPIELGMRSAGAPDINGVVDRQELWVECKRSRRWEVSLRPGQIAWIHRRHRVGGRCLIAVRRRVRGEDELWLYCGSRVRELRMTGLRERAGLLGYWRGGPDGWDWSAVRCQLATGRPGRPVVECEPPQP